MTSRREPSSPRRDACGRRDTEKDHRSRHASGKPPEKEEKEKGTPGRRHLMAEPEVHRRTSRCGGLAVPPSARAWHGTLESSPVLKEGRLQEPEYACGQPKQEGIASRFLLFCSGPPSLREFQSSACFRGVASRWRAWCFATTT